MGFIVEWIFWVAIAVIAGFLGNSRREEKRVDPDKKVMRQQPALRFSMYIVGFLIGAMFVFLGTMAIRDGAHKEEPWILFVLLIGILAGIFCIGAGYVLYAKHVFFDAEELIVGRPFKSSLHVKWQEISRMEMKKSRLLLYGADGKRLVKADPSLENYDLFAGMAKRMCSAKLVRAPGAEWKNGERVIGRVPAARVMYAIAALLLFCTVGIALLDKRSVADLFAVREMAVFPVVLVIAAAILLYGVWLQAEKIRYTRQEITFCRLFSKKTFTWRSLRKIRRAVEGMNGVEKLYLTWEGREYVVNSAKFQQGYAELLDFVIGVALEQNVPTENL